METLPRILALPGPKRKSTGAISAAIRMRIRDEPGRMAGKAGQIVNPVVGGRQVSMMTLGEVEGAPV